MGKLNGGRRCRNIQAQVGRVCVKDTQPTYIQAGTIVNVHEIGFLRTVLP